MTTAPPTGVEVKTEYFPLSFFYGMCSVHVVINGAELPAKWGTQFYPLSPGRYNIGCFTNYLVTPKCGLNTVDIDLSPGQVFRVTWSAPVITVMKGPIKAELIASAPTSQMMPPPTVETVAQDNRCGRCYAAMAPGAAFCTACGNAAALLCPGCGKPDTGARFCIHCSRQLRA